MKVTQEFIDKIINETNQPKDKFLGKTWFHFMHSLSGKIKITIPTIQIDSTAVCGWTTRTFDSTDLDGMQAFVDSLLPEFKEKYGVNYES